MNLPKDKCSCGISGGQFTEPDRMKVGAIALVASVTIGLAGLIAAAATQDVFWAFALNIPNGVFLADLFITYIYRYKVQHHTSACAWRYAKLSLLMPGII